MDSIAIIREKFLELFGSEPRLFRAPGRVNLIGEHTDYNDGFVLPASINLETIVAIAPRPDRRIVIHSQYFPGETDFSLDDWEKRKRRHWSDYVRGVALLLEQEGKRLRGADLLIASDVPIGAGLASSAALEIAAALALLDAGQRSMDRLALAKLCQRAEHEYAGTRCGIMDQFVACFGKKDHALLLDCRSMENRLIPLPAQVRIVLCNTMVRHSLASGEYNTRRAECEAGVLHFAKHGPGVRALRDVTITQFEQFGVDLPEKNLRRCRHVISENARTQEFARALEKGDLAGAGRAMAASHRSLRDDYEVSCPELDVLTELARQQPGCIGARMTGGGFGGCTVNLVRNETVEEFCHAVRTGFEAQFGRMPEIYTCEAVEGAGPITSH
ncbi:MAG: galactokinase [Acidobacteria bacterium]|nr:galactokinase [Acidobacteriota bacterium]